MRVFFAEIEKVFKSLEVIRRYNPKVPFTVKPSIDGVGERHDEIRGIKGNFNIDHLSEIEDYVHSQGVQSYRNEVAEQRTEFFNLTDPITPDAETYERLIREFSEKIRKNVSKKRKLAKITESLRLVYYDLVVRILREKCQVTCYAGISNVHINYNDEVWPCCVLGYSQPMGFLREQNYDFQEIWHSDQANGVRKYIKDGNCACPLANQAYSNIFCSPKYLLKAINNIIWKIGN